MELAAGLAGAVVRVEEQPVGRFGPEPGPAPDRVRVVPPGLAPRAWALLSPGVPVVQRLGRLRPHVESGRRVEQRRVVRAEAEVLGPDVQSQVPGQPTRTVTVAIEAMTFRKAVHVGDVVSVHAELVRMGRTSLTVHIEAWVLRRNENAPILVTDGNFTYVSIDDKGQKQLIKRGDATLPA